MSLSHQRWIPVGEPAHDGESRALDKIRELLSDDPLCLVWTNLSIPDSHDFPTEIDLLLLNGAGLFVVELKGWSGEITGTAYDWRRRTGKQPWRPWRSPVLAAQSKAQRLKSLLQELKHEQREQVRLPYVTPVVVMHGRNSSVGLDDRAMAQVYGLDTYGVTGVPAFSTFLREPPCGGQARLDKPAVDAIRRLLVRSGMTPQRVLPREITQSIGTNLITGDEPSAMEEPQAEAIDPLPQDIETVLVPLGLFEGQTDDDLLRLGVPVELIESVRAIVDEADLIDIVSEDLFNDLDSVLAGEDASDVVSRREALVVILKAVDAQAATTPPNVDEPDTSQLALRSSETDAGPRTERPVVEVPPVDLLSSTDHAQVNASDMFERLRSVFGDRVSHRPSQTRLKQKPRVPSSGLHSGHRNDSHEVARAQSEVSVASERLLDLARAETLQSRPSAARELLDEVHSFMNRFGSRDWSTHEVDELAGRLSNHSLLAQRLELLVEGLPSGMPTAPAIETGPTVPAGTLWTKGEIGPPYSLLLRGLDVLDRVNGIYLSQLIGTERAAEVNARLLKGRPDGGRIRITPSGVVVSRRNADAPWFVVGSVEAHEWFPAEMIAAA